MPLFYIEEPECSPDYVMIFAEHTTKYAGIYSFLIFVVYIETNSYIL